MAAAAGPEAVLRRDRWVTAAGLVLVAGGSWGYMFYDAWRMDHTASCCLAVAGASLGEWPVSALALMFVMWSVMMAAMMIPSAAPMVLVFARVNRQRRQERRPYVPTGLFLAGYLAVWTLFSAVITLVQWYLHARALLSPRMVSTSPIFGGVVLVAAGVFQFTRMKDTCLRHCRTPLQFLLTSWREGYAGAWRMGLEHGWSCTGCCWLLMVLLFVAGVMNLLWVATIAMFVLVEKLLPGQWISRVGGAALIGWGGYLLLRR